MTMAAAHGIRAAAYIAGSSPRQGGRKGQFFERPTSLVYKHSAEAACTINLRLKIHQGGYYE